MIVKSMVFNLSRNKCFAILLLSLVTVANLAQEKKETDKSSTESPSSVSPSEKVANDFVIGPGDSLQIYVWKEPELSKIVPVRPDGKISLPLVNDVQAGGLTAVQLKKSIEEKLLQFISDPNVTVTVETVNSQKVIVMGEVTTAGPRPLAGPLRIMDILAGAGFTPFAKTTKIYVLRIEDGKQQKIFFNYKDYLKGKNPEQNILLKNGDTIVVP
ncbi:MAG: polysaccharide biosynthesis/export family protein [Terriglobia bacterium]